MNKILKYIPHTFVVILAIIVAIGFANYKKLQRDAREYRAQMLHFSEMYKTENANAVKMAEEYKKIKTENSTLNKEIEKNKETIKNLTKINANIKDSVASVITAPDTVYVDSTPIGVRRFNVSKGNFMLRGYFKLQVPYDITFEEMRAKIIMEIAMTQDKHLIWKSYITSPDPSFDVSGVQTSVVPYSPGFWDKLKFGAGAYASSNRVGGMAGVYYGRLGINVLADKHGAAVGAQYLFGIRR